MRPDLLDGMFLAEDAVAPLSGEVLAEAADEITPGLLERMREAGIKRLSVLHTKGTDTSSSIRDTLVLDRIPDDASVTATTFLVVPLSRRAVLYDLRYCSQEHLLSTDYVVVETTDSGSIVQTLQAKASCSRRSVRRWSRGSSSMPPPAPNKPFTAPAAAPVSPARSHVPRFCIRDPSG